MSLIDSHCHLHDREFFTSEEAEECLKRAREKGVEKVICIGTSHEDSLAARDFAATHDNVYWTYGIHPEHSDSYEQSAHGFSGDGSLAPVVTGLAPSFSVVTSESPQEACARLPKTIENSNQIFTHSRKTGSVTRPVAVGEVGLDYHYEGYDREAQIRLFEEMLQLATDNQLPVSFHVREAFSDFFAVVENFPQVRGVVHSFTDSKKVLKKILNETEFYIGVNGLATYSTLPLPPLERILLETDAPFLAPVPHRGEKNEPAYIPDVARWLATRLEVSWRQVAETTTGNAEKLFGI